MKQTYTDKTVTAAAGVALYARAARAGRRHRISGVFARRRIKPQPAPAMAAFKS
jgi:hypothetical protein